jgi:hypothetical protein
MGCLAIIIHKTQYGENYNYYDTFLCLETNQNCLVFLEFYNIYYFGYFVKLLRKHLKKNNKNKISIQVEENINAAQKKQVGEYQKRKNKGVKVFHFAKGNFWVHKMHIF